MIAVKLLADENIAAPLYRKVAVLSHQSAV
jgi:hypothetical protein